MDYDDLGICRLILASGSPRRRQLLSMLGIPFIIKAVEVDERQFGGESPPELVLRLSQAKALAVTDNRPDELVVAADTVVALGDTVLGKPVGVDHAFEMLRDLRNRAHVVYSGVSVWHPVTRRMVREISMSTVWMRDYTDDEMARYIESGDPFDKAGAYAIQHPEFRPVDRVEGCWLGVVGLPLCHLGRALADFGVAIPVGVAATCHAFSQRECDVSSQILRDRQENDALP
mgnify:CR=1 FL=1